MLVAETTTTDPPAQLRDSEDSLELRRDGVKIFGRDFISKKVHKEDSTGEHIGAQTGLVADISYHWLN